MAMTPEEKAERARERMIETCKCNGIKKFQAKFVAKDFQRMIRAEYAAKGDNYELAIVGGKLRGVFRRSSQCVCVTCGKVDTWNSGGMHTGHFLGGRFNSILFEETNVAPQCNYCNTFDGGAQQKYRQWMEAVRGTDEIDRLRKLKNESVSFTRDELVDMRIAYAARLKSAELIIEGGTS